VGFRIMSIFSCPLSLACSADAALCEWRRATEHQLLDHALNHAGAFVLT
jgi:hypothetical protein